MTKILKNTFMILALLLCCTFVFVGCEQEGEEETPHHLEVKAACYVDGEKDDAWVLSHPDELTGSGDYAEQDRVDLIAPSEDYYQFIGWYDEEGTRVGLPHNFWWNMEYDRDGYVEARYIPLEYDIQFLNEKDVPTSIMAHYNCVTKKLKYDGQEAQVVDSLPAPIHVEHYLNEKWLCYIDQVPTVCDDFPITENYEGLTPLVSGQPELKLTLQAEYEDVYYTLPTITVKDTDGNTITGLDSCIKTTYKDASGTEITDSIESYKYGTSISLFVKSADMTGYDYVAINLNGDEATKSVRFDNHILEENDAFEIIVKAQLYTDLFEFRSTEHITIDDWSTVSTSTTILGAATTVEGTLASPNAIALNKGDEVKTEYNTSFTLYIETVDGYRVSNCEVNESSEGVSIVEEGGVYEITYTVTGIWNPKEIVVEFDVNN